MSLNSVVHSLRSLRPFAILLFLCLLAPVSGFSQQSDPDALARLRALKARYAAFTAMSMDFSLDITDIENGSTETKKGKMWVKGDQFRVQLDEQTVICDNQTIWVYLSDVNEVQITEYEPESEDFMSPSELFQLPEKEFFVAATGQTTLNNQKVQVLELAPLDKDLAYYKIKLFIRPAENELVQAVVMDKNGIHYTYKVDQFKGNPAIDTDTFRFNPAKFPNVEVIDLR